MKTSFSPAYLHVARYDECATEETVIHKQLWNKSTQWPLGDIAVISKVQSPKTRYRNMLWALMINCPQMNATKQLWWKSALVQVMVWSHQATSHYRNQCCPKSMSSYGVTKPHWVKYQLQILILNWSYVLRIQPIDKMGKFELNYVIIYLKFLFAMNISYPFPHYLAPFVQWNHQSRCLTAQKAGNTCELHQHYNDVIMSAMASQITSLTIVYSTVYSGADQRKHQNSASLAFVWGIHRWPVNSPRKWPVTRKMFPFDDVIMS